MIFGNIRNEKEFNFLPKNIKECFYFAKENDLKNFEPGSYRIKGDDLFVNIVEYETTEVENRFWEAHRNYLDMHFILDGEERIDINFIENMKQDEFVEKDDFLPLHGDEIIRVPMNVGDFLICYPHDAHRTAVKVNESVKLKKAIFKIKIDI